MRYFAVVFSNQFALLCYLPLLIGVMKHTKKSKTTALGQWKTWSQDLRRQKWNFLKTRRKLWSAAARDRAYSYPNSWYSLFLTSSEDLSINALWSSTRRTWLLYYYCLWITAKIILLTCECWGCHDFFGWWRTLLTYIQVKARHVYNSSNGDNSPQFFARVLYLYMN